MTPLEECVNDLAAALPRAQALTHIPDTDGTTSRSAPGSRPPWNPAAATALLDALEGARQLEASWRSGVVRPMAATGAVLASIVRLSSGLPDCPPRQYDEQNRPKPCRCERCDAVYDISGWVTVIYQLAAVDLAEPVQRPPVPCPRCRRKMLRFWPRKRELACLGCMKKADVADGGVSGDPMLVWEDGLVQVAPVLEWEDELVT